MASRLHPPIIWINADSLSIGPLETIWSEILIKTQMIDKNAYENIVCKLSAIVSASMC